MFTRLNPAWILDVLPVWGTRYILQEAKDETLKRNGIQGPGNLFRGLGYLDGLGDFVSVRIILISHTVSPEVCPSHLLAESSCP